MKKSLLLSLLSAGLLLGCMKGKVDLKSEEDKTFYAVGAMFGQRLNNLQLTDKELDALAQGLRDSAQDKKLAVETTEYQGKIQNLFRDRMAKQAETVKKDGQAFMEKFLKEGGKKTASGLAYKIIKPGEGSKPKETDVVKVHYHGTLVDGTVFDSSVERGKEVSFPLNRVIRGWTEGLQLVGVGGKIRLVIPSDLAYGDQGAPPKIPGGATLVFDVDLYDIQAPPEPKQAKKKSGKKK